MCFPLSSKVGVPSELYSSMDICTWPVLPWRNVAAMGWNQWQNDEAPLSSAHLIIALATLSALALSLIQE